MTDLYRYISDQFIKYREDKAAFCPYASETLSRQSEQGTSIKTLDIGHRLLVENPNPTPSAGIPPFNAAIFSEAPSGGGIKYTGSSVLIRTSGTARRFAVTAGHVLPKAPDSRLFLALGNDSRWVDDNNRLNPARVVWNGAANPGNPSTDLAILELTDPDQVEAGGVGILGPKEFEQYRREKSLAIVFGWGDFGEHGVIPRKLRDLVMEMLPENPGGTANCFTCDHFADRGPCRGDSGGPLLTLQGRTPLLAGIVKGLREQPGHNRCHSRAYPMEFLDAPVIGETLGRIGLS